MQVIREPSGTGMKGYCLSTRLLVLVAAIAPLASGCAILNGFLDPTTVGSFPSEYYEVGIRRVLTPRDGPEGLPNAVAPTPQDLVPDYSEYRLEPSDVLSIVIEDLFVQGLAWQAQLEVNSAGYIRLPLIGSVRVSTLTEAEAEDEIKTRLRSAGILPNPNVQLITAVRRARFFSIIGNVSQAGPYALSQPDLRLLDAIGLARDIGPQARLLYVIRRTEPDFAPPEATSPDTIRQKPEEGLIIEPPPLEQFEIQGGAIGGGIASTASWRQEARPAQPPADAASSQPSDEDRRLLEEVIAPQSSSPTPRDDGRQAPASNPSDETEGFRPFMFEPGEEEPVEARPRPTPESAETDETPMAPTEPEAAAGPDGDFPWEAVPEYELTQRVIEIDVNALKAGDPRYNIVVRPRDVIRVPVDTGLYYLMGEIGRPGVYSFGGREITLKQAVAIAGGLGPLAWPQRVEIIRREPGTDQEIIIPVNLDAIFAGREADVLLRDNDIVNVGTHIVAPFLLVIRNSFRFTYGFGFVYDRNFADKDSYFAKENPQSRNDRLALQRGLPF